MQQHYSTYTVCLENSFASWLAAEHAEQDQNRRLCDSNHLQHHSGVCRLLGPRVHGALKRLLGKTRFHVFKIN